jgi:carbon starvation protein
MNSLVLLIGGIVLFLAAYICYGGYLAKKWGLSNNRKTPAHNHPENTSDYCPTDVRVLFGHHFSSIAGAGPITGPILAAVFGWIPVYLWIVLGSIFIGGVHDFGSLAASLDNDGKSIGEIIKTNVSTRAQKIFNWYAWATITLVVAAFTDICAKTFTYDPAVGDMTGAQAGTASIIFIGLAFLFGFARNRLHAPLGISTLLGVILVACAIVLGYYCPILKFNLTTWRIILIVYIFAASVLPVWLLLQPRDYLCSFLLYAMMAGAIIGIFVKRPAVNMAGFTSFTVNGQWLFPVLFVTVACGAISGFHSLISSGTTSKQLEKERPDAQIIGYGAMLVEGLLAIVALIVVAYVSKDGQTFASDGSKLGTPAVVFANGVAEFMHTFGIPLQVGKVFVTLAYSAFALTSLDTATRIGRYLLQELSGGKNAKGIAAKACSNMYVATIITVAASIVFLLAGYVKIWPIFGSANQLLAALALLAITAWMLKKGKKSLETIIPQIFMFAVTFTALILLIIKNLQPNGFVPLSVIGIILFLLAVLQLIEAVRVFAGRKNK